MGPVLPLLAQWAAADAKLEVRQGGGGRRGGLPAVSHVDSMTTGSLHLMHNVC